MTTPTTFRKADVTRALKATVAAGLTVAGVRFHPTGGFDIVTAEAADKPATNPWDEDDDET